MAFQFLCPQGHMLQGDESQAGQQCACPYCQTMFLVPQPMVRTVPMPQPVIPQYVPQQPYVPQPVAPLPVVPLPVVPQPIPAQPFQPQPVASPGPPPLPIPQPVAPASVVPAEEPQEVAETDDSTTEGETDFLTAGPRRAPIRRPMASGMPTRPTRAIPAVLHILCPNGHSLETPREMLGQDAICPHCDTEFRLCYETSVEYRKEKDAKEEEQEIEVGNVWLNFSIIAAVVVILGIIFLIVLSQ
jgi:hypothetical protein